MSMISPDVYTREIDFSTYVQNLANTVAGMVITARTGPVGEPVFISNVSSGLYWFGKPVAPVEGDTSGTLGVYALFQFLREGNQAWVIRAAGPDAAQPLVDVYNADAPAALLTSNYERFALAAAAAAALVGNEVGSYTITAGTSAYWLSGVVNINDNAGLDLDGTPLSTGKLTINLDGTSATITGIDFTGNTTGAQAATTLQTAINAATNLVNAGKTCTVTWSAGTTKFTITSDGYGTDSNVTLSATGGGGVDLYTVLGGAEVAGTDGNERIDIDVDNNGSVTNYAFSLTAGVRTITQVVSDLNGGLTDVTAIDYTANVGHVIKLVQATAGASYRFRINEVTGSAYATLGLDATLDSYIAGTDANNSLKLTFTNVDENGDAVTPVTHTFTLPVESTLGLGVTAQSIVDALNDDMPTDSNMVGGPGDAGVAEVVVKNGKKHVKVKTSTKGANATLLVVNHADTTSHTALGFTKPQTANGLDAGDSPTLRFKERYPGDRSISVVVAEGSDYVEGTNEVYRVDVYEADQRVALYDGLYKVPPVGKENDTFEKKIGTAATPVDHYIIVEDYPAVTQGPDSGTYTLATASTDPSGLELSAGGAEIIGEDNGVTKTGLQHFRSKETFDLAFIMAAGQSDPAVVAELVDIAETRQDLIAIIDPPDNLSPAEVKDWHNGVGNNNPPAALNSSYAALYYPWVKVYDQVNKTQVWTPPSGHVAAAIARTDRTAEPWYAPAGMTRGRIPVAIDLRVRLDKGQRDLLLGGTSRVNTIVSFANEGVAIFSQKTLMRQASALNDIGVRRLLIIAIKSIAAATRALLFEPNDVTTWGRFTMMVNPFLNSIAQKRGLTEFRVVMDGTTTTPDMRDRNEARGILYLRPTKAAEKIQLDFVVMSQSVSFNSISSMVF